MKNNIIKDLVAEACQQLLQNGDGMFSRYRTCDVQCAEHPSIVLEKLGITDIWATYYGKGMIQVTLPDGEIAYVWAHDAQGYTWN